MGEKRPCRLRPLETREYSSREKRGGLRNRNLTGNFPRKTKREEPGSISLERRWGGKLTYKRKTQQLKARKPPCSLKLKTDTRKMRDNVLRMPREKRNGASM